MVQASSNLAVLPPSNSLRLFLSWPYYLPSRRTLFLSDSQRDRKEAEEKEGQEEKEREREKEKGQRRNEKVLL